MLTFGITRWEATQSVMAAKLTRLTHKIAIQPHLVAESCTICSSRSRRPVLKLLDTPSYIHVSIFWVVTPCGDMVGYQRLWGSHCFHLQLLNFLEGEDGGSVILRNVGILPQWHTAPQPTRQRLESSSPWKPQILYCIYCIYVCIYIIYCIYCIFFSL
jgi:hypothetical protein